MSRSIWQFLVERLSQGERAALLVVTESQGSSPGRRGFMMAVTLDAFVGSVGGGVMEVRLVEDARERLRAGASPAPMLVRGVHRADAPDASGMICSGSQRVVTVCLGTAELPLVKRLAVHVEGNTSVRWGITRDGIQLLDGGGEEPQGSDQPDGVLFTQALVPPPRLYLVGGGHCALALSEVAARLGFTVAVFDDRPALQTVLRNTFASEVHTLGSYEEIGGHIPSDGSAFVVVMTLGYASDLVAVRQLIHHELRYLGVLGSRAKATELKRGLMRAGVSAEWVTSVRSPIGVPIHSRTPEEIAVSIAAELIGVKNGRRGTTRLDAHADFEPDVQAPIVHAFPNDRLPNTP